jgi:hypothetical protein
MKNAKGFRASSVSEPSGTYHAFGGDEAEKVVDTVQCVHCGRHWLWEPGSGKQRGFCLGCNGITCGSKKCDVCVPMEQQLENMEAGHDLTFRPIMSSVPRDIKSVK